MAGSITRYIQLGRETNAGTAVAATTIWSGPATNIKDEHKVTFVNEQRGRMSPSSKVYSPALGATIAFPNTEATFEQLNHVFEAGIKAVTAAADGAGTGKVYAYPLPTTAALTQKTYTIEAGDGQQEGEMEYSFVESFSLAGKGNEAVMVASKWRGRQLTASTKTGSLIVPVVNEIVKWVLYLEAGWLARGNRLPFGSSLVMLARRPAI